MLAAAGRAIAGVTGFGILVVGGFYLVKPRAMATNFGLASIPSEEATAWLQLKGIRDVATGIVAGVLIVAADPDVLGWSMVAFAIIPIGDASTILREKGPLWAALGIHGVTAAIMLIGSVLLLTANSLG